MSEQELRDRIDELEWRLLKHHEALNEAIEQRDRLALDAAWGVVTSSASQIGFIAPIVALGIFVDDKPWWSWLIAAALGLSLQTFMFTRADRMRRRDIDDLRAVPEWDARL